MKVIFYVSSVLSDAILVGVIIKSKKQRVIKKRRKIGFKNQDFN